MITSASNTRVKKVAALNQKAKERRQEGKYVVEGVKMFLEAPEEEIEEIYAVEGFQNAACMEKLAGRPFETVSEEVFRKMSDTAAPQGILCVMRQKKYALADLLAAKNPLLMILEDIQDPGNLGTMLRTGEGAGITAVIMSKKTADLFNPKTIRSTMGSVYRVPFCYVEDLKAVIEKMHAAGIQTYAAHLQGKNSYTQECYSAKTAFLIGNEGNGLSDEIAALAMCKIRIPMEGQVESLNAAVSAAILMYEAKRQNN